MRPRVGRLLGLSDLQPISHEQFARSVDLRALVSDLVQARDGYIASHHKDPSVALPAANWGLGAANDFLAAYRHVLTGGFDVVNNLRFYTQAFTGYQLMSFRSSAGLRSVNPVPDDFDAVLKRTVTGPDLWVERYLDLIEGLPDTVVARAPRVLGEIGWDVDGSPVNADVCAYQERLNFLHNSGVLPILARRAANRERVRILEIGAGYGALAYFLRRFLPTATFYLVDLPESLLFSSLYLSLADGFETLIYPGSDPERLSSAQDAYVFVPNYAADDLAASGVRIDLAINTLSFGEMSPTQVAHYAALIAECISDAGVLFEQNPARQDVLAEDRRCDPKAVLAERFPYRRPLPSELLSRGTKPLFFRRGVADLWSNEPFGEGAVTPERQPRSSTQ